MAELTFVEKYFKDEGRVEGIALGEQRAQRSIYERLISSGKFTAQEAAEFTGWNANNAAYGLQ